MLKLTLYFKTNVAHVVIILSQQGATSRGLLVLQKPELIGQPDFNSNPNLSSDITITLTDVNDYDSIHTRLKLSS